MTPPARKPMSHDTQLAYLLSFYDKFEEWKEEKRKLIAQVPVETLALSRSLDAQFRPFINHVVKFKHPVGKTLREVFENRVRKVIESGMNTFLMPATYLDLDFLSDSGSSAMTTKMWGELVDGDESYGSNEGWPMFNDTVSDIFGKKFASVFLGKHADAGLNAKYHLRKNFNYLTNQGRGAESVLYPCLAQCLVMRDSALIDSRGLADVTYYICCSNNFFDTTSAHILNIHDREFKTRSGRVVHVTFDLVNHPNRKVAEGTYTEDDIYLGDGNFEALTALFKRVEPWQIGLVVTTITNNSGGSQPVSLAHIAAVSELCKKNKVMYIFDACRFAENAYMIQLLETKRNAGFSKSVQQIVYEMFEHVDGFTISLKKDGIANGGGALCFAPTSTAVQTHVDQEGYCLMQLIMDTVILNIGHFTYGSITGRDIKAITVGLRTVVREDYLRGRVGQVHRFAQILIDLGVPILKPCGTSAVYIDTDKFFDVTPATKAANRAKFYGISLVGILLCAGIRACELGASAFSSPHGNAPYKAPEDVSGNFVRMAIPRQIYSDSDLYGAALWLKFLYERKSIIKGVIDREGLRQLSLHHFKMLYDFEE